MTKKCANKKEAGGRGKRRIFFFPITHSQLPITYEAVGFGNEANLSK
jgi:hypothetical protein